MTSNYYFFGINAEQKATAFSEINKEFRPKIYEQQGRWVVTLVR